VTPPVDELMRVVRVALRPYAGHREYEDIYSEALIHAWQVVSRSAWDHWTTIAWRAAHFQAGEYLRNRRSGRLTTRREAAIYPAWIEEQLEIADDGGIAAADARLQLWVWQRPVPLPEQPTCLICNAPLTGTKSGRPQVYCSKRCKWRQLERVRRQRKALARQEKTR